MSERQIERGDTFTVMEEQFRGNHFTCVGGDNDKFFAGDTNGRMWRFKREKRDRYSVHRDQGPVWKYRGTIVAESIVIDTD